MRLGRSPLLSIGLALPVIGVGCSAPAAPAGGRTPPATAPVSPPMRFLIKAPVTRESGTEKLYGYIDETGRVVIPPAFNDAENFEDGIATVWVDDADGGHHRAFIDDAGRTLFSVPRDVDTNGWFREGLALANLGATKTGHHQTDGGHGGYLDHHGNWAIPPKFAIPNGTAYDYSANPANMFDEGMAAMVAPDGRWGFIDRSGRWVIPPLFAAVKAFDGPLARVTLKRHEEKGEHVSIYVEDEWGYIDRAGKVVWRSGPERPPGA